MLRPLATALLLLIALPVTLVTGVRAIEADPADFLPPGVAILQTIQGDVDGDGRDDLLTLYTLPAPASTPPHAGLLLLTSAEGGAKPVHLFGAPPQNLRGEPVLDPRGSTNLELRDLTGDGRAEIVLTVVNRFQNPIPDTMLWVFGRGETPARGSVEDGGPPPSPLVGTGYRLELFLDGSNIEVLPGDGKQASTIRRTATEQRISGPEPKLQVAESYTWRNGGFRLAERSLTLPDGVSGGNGPETAVLGFYTAVARGDLAAASAFMTDELRATRSSNTASNPDAASHAMRVEEIRLLDSGVTRRSAPGTERTVYVRASTAEGEAGARHSFAGAWHLRRQGEQWKLASASLHQTAELAAVADTLPPGYEIAETAGGDLRGLGVEDVAVLASAPARYALMEPWIVWGGPNGLERSEPLATYVDDPVLGGVAGSIGIDDVNGDGKPEITFSGIVGAHSATLWVLGWNGSQLTSLFDGVSNSPVVGLEDLDEDGVPEILLVQSGYCGSYASSPALAFAFRWESGAYQSASMRYPSMYDGLDEHASGVLAQFPAGGQGDASRACVQHLLATANVLRNRPRDARAAYRAYAELRQQAPVDTRSFVRPVYLADPYVEADLRATLAAAEDGRLTGWAPTELAIIHDLLGDALTDRARIFQSQADRAAERGRPDEAIAARRKATEARQAASAEYKAALGLDPNDDEAQRALGG